LPFLFVETKTMQTNSEFLIAAANAARAAGHIWPNYAACETALESAWGASRLAVEANNLFGQKQPHPPIAGTQTLPLPTKEFLHGQWIEQSADWVHFPDLPACFRARMEMLRRESAEHPHFAAALTGADFIREVSLTCSTDPARAEKVLAIYGAHASAFTVASVGLPQPQSTRPLSL
jgi:flagellum-specific peptidoglycan hydrolase FlgJ